MARREQADSDLSTLNCPALLFGNVGRFASSAGLQQPPRLLDGCGFFEAFAVGWAHKCRVAVPRLFATTKKRRSHLNLLELPLVSTGQTSGFSEHLTRVGRAIQEKHRLPEHSECGSVQAAA